MDDIFARVAQGVGGVAVDEEFRVAAVANIKLWLTEERFVKYQPAIRSIIARGDYDLLVDSFYRMLPFGTGGRRGAVGVGPNRMNPYTVTASVQGHCVFLQRRFPGAELKVVVAADVRRFTDIRGNYDANSLGQLYGMTSKQLSKLAAMVYSANGIRVYMADPADDTFLSTPELSYLILALDANGGLNISASHNHPDDNGAKFYNAAGGQEVPPHDEELVVVASSVVNARQLAFGDAVERGLVQFLSAPQRQDYVDLNVALSLTPEYRGVRVAFSPLHGAGSTTALPVLEQAGFEVVVCKEQEHFDGSFPNVPYRMPNPEVPSAMEAVILTARQHDCALAMATDPDADRLGVAVPDQEGNWQCLSGNQIGLLMAYHVLSSRHERGDLKSSHYVIKTEVTTEMLTRLAQSFGVRCIGHLLVGFKYIGDVLDKIRRTGRFGDFQATPEDFLLAMEESHGVLAVETIRDKDAANGALLIAEFAAKCQAQDSTLYAELLGLYRTYGYFGTALKTIVMEGTAGMANIRRIQASLRNDPPVMIGGRKVVASYDRQDEDGPFGPISSETDRNSRDVLVFVLEGGARLVLRPSGTEPKNKSYAEIPSEPLGEDISDEKIHGEMDRVNGQLRDLLSSWERELLRRIDIDYPRYATYFSGNLPLRRKLHFVDSVETELRAIVASRVDPGIASKRVAKLLRDVGPVEMLQDGLTRLGAGWGDRDREYLSRVVSMLDLG